jgi:hypothetical protein
LRDIASSPEYLDARLPSIHSERALLLIKTISLSQNLPFLGYPENDDETHSGIQSKLL